MCRAGSRIRAADEPRHRRAPAYSLTERTMLDTWKEYYIYEHRNYLPMRSRLRQAEAEASSVAGTITPHDCQSSLNLVETKASSMERKVLAAGAQNDLGDDYPKLADDLLTPQQAFNTRPQETTIISIC